MQWRAEREAWRHPYPGVVCVPGSSWNHKTQLAAVQQHLGPRAAAGGQSAAWLYGLVPRAPSRPHLLLPHAQRVKTDGIFVRRSRHVEDQDRIALDGLSVLTPTFWSISMAATTDGESLRASIIDLRQRRRLVLARVWSRLETLPHVPGRRRLLRILTQLDADGSDSVFEFQVRRRLEDIGVYPAAAPWRVVVAGGRAVHLDIAFVRERVAIECIGFIAHSSRSQLNSDARRENALAMMNEWLILKLTWDRFLHDWEGFVRELRAALAARG
ncbi:MAG: type IV toxin-antitoxin system AbiEi family antitoxin [Egibacteraceae bacterium]